MFAENHDSGNYSEQLNLTTNNPLPLDYLNESEIDCDEDEFFEEDLLSGRDFRGACLIGVDKRGADLFNADFSNADLTDAKLADADLRGANLRGADLTGADLSGADLFGADLSGACFESARLVGADLKGANLTGADFYNANLSDTDLFNVDLSGACLENSNLEDADLREADLSGASLNGANLINADINTALFYNPDSPYVIKEAIGPSVAQLQEAKNWQKAEYSQPFRQKLGLPPNNPNYPSKINFSVNSIVDVRSI